MIVSSTEIQVWLESVKTELKKKKLSLYKRGAAITNNHLRTFVDYRKKIDQKYLIEHCRKTTAIQQKFSYAAENENTSIFKDLLLYPNRMMISMHEH